jgi:hypothetical protein
MEEVITFRISTIPLLLTPGYRGVTWGCPSLSPSQELEVCLNDAIPILHSGVLSSVFPVF